MSRILYLLGGTALGIMAPKIAKLAKGLYNEHSDPRLFNKRRCRSKTADEARREAETANPGNPNEPSEDPVA
ncbi:MAG: hypothetical protein LBR80_15285 [Deltaproteobacteria bacterium]|jgi:hypothetical protein|nr:hypothetical protein [Deltaproteobacteria bacterium]